MRLVISEPASGKSYQTEISREQEANIVGKKIGDTLDGNLVGAAAYVFKLTGGSDNSGFPMKGDIGGSARKFSIVGKGIGFRARKKGERRRKHVRGNTYSADIVQVNVKVAQGGAVPLEQLFQGKKEEKK